jgi:hypothetical protein
MSNVPALASLIFNDNLVWAVPLTSNHVGERTAANSNVLACAAFGPMLSGCACPRGLVFSTHCGYGRCLSTMDGCGVGLLFNNRSCAAAPSSTCIASCAAGQYYSAGLQECVAVTQCSTAFRQGSTTQFQKAYQFDDVTATSDRQCSICSTCPSGETRSPPVPCCPGGELPDELILCHIDHADHARACLQGTTQHCAHRPRIASAPGRQACPPATLQRSPLLLSCLLP